MPDIILHNYKMSPFSQKIRRALAFKEMPWLDVTMPSMMPKPRLLPLTGGYRRAPVMQVGADIYCDTSLIARRLDQLQPDPMLLPPGTAGLARLLSDWADRRCFSWSAVSLLIGRATMLSPEFTADRQAMSPALMREVGKGDALHAQTQWRWAIDAIDTALADSPFLLGAAFTLADASCWHPLWAMSLDRAVFAEVEQRPRLFDWFRRVSTIGVVRVSPLTDAAALAVARDAAPLDIEPDGEQMPGDPPVGTRISVVADDTGPEATIGTLLRSSVHEIAMLRDDPEVGQVAVHFPRLGFRVAPLA